MTQSSKVVEIVVSSIDEEAIKRFEHVGAQGMTISAWIDKMISQGTHLLSYFIKLLDNLNSVKSQLDQTLDLLSQELQMQEKTLMLGQS